MKKYNDCLSCIARGSLDAAKLATDDESLQLKIVKTVLSELCAIDLSSPPPLMAIVIQRAVRAITGVSDPYAGIKKTYNDFALGLYPELEKRLAPVSFDTAVRLSIAGNIIDFGTHNTVGEKKVLDTIEHALTTDINGVVSRFESACDKAGKILFIGDNAGEIVFDKFLLAKMEKYKITYSVRGGATQNDATLEDAEYTGITQMVNVITTGAAIPGVILECCSEEFRDHYEQADMIISKGQGNFETLDHRDRRIFFLFKAKCPVVAGYAGCNLNDMMIQQGGCGRLSDH